MRMRSFITVFLLTGMLCTGTHLSFAQKTAEHPTADLDGKVWLGSTEQEKRSFLFGAGSALVLEYYVREKHSEEPSKFVKGWVTGLKDMTWTDMANRIDTYYKNNPDKTNRHVFDVIWHEIIEPKLQN